MLYSKKIERNEHFDIVVVGGGVAGFYAAVAAGRLGKKTALIEDMGELGGIMTTGGNPQIGIFFAYYKQVIAGIGWELCKNLEAMDFADIPDFSAVDTRKGCEQPNVKVCMPMAEAEMNRMCKEAGVELFFHSKLIDVIAENGSVKYAVIADKSGLRSFSAEVFIDCTGDGDLSVLSGADYEKSDILQPGTLGYTFRCNNVGELDKDMLQARFKQKWESGEVLHGDHWPAYHAPIIGYFKAGGCNSNHIVMDSSTAEGMTQAEIEGREKMARMLRFAKENAFYIAIFDVDKIDRPNMDATRDGIMKAVYVPDVVDWYDGKRADGSANSFTVSGIDGLSIGPVFGAPKNSETRLMLCSGIYENPEVNSENDYHTILQFDWRELDRIAAPLSQLEPHHIGMRCETNYFLDIAKTTWGIQNLEYDAYNQSWLVCVYRGKKEGSPNLPMYIIDGTVAPILRDSPYDKAVPHLTLRQEGIYHEETGLYGTRFPKGQEGVYSFGNGLYYFAYAFKTEEKKNGGIIKLCRRTNDPQEPFAPVEE